MPDPTTYLDVDGQESILSVGASEAEVWTDVPRSVLDVEED